MKLRLFIQAIVLIMTLKGFAQTEWTFRGKVLSNGQELVGVQFEDDRTRKVIALSDEDGLFSFVSKSQVVIVTYLGYKDFRLVHQSNTITVELQEEESLLKAVVVSENRRSSKLSNTTVSLEIIKPKLIANTSPTNIEESISRINGVQVVDNQPTIRSGSGWSYGAGSRVQVLVNDIPLLSGDAGQPLWSFVPTEGIESIEIIKGASSVLYGSSALNGVINIKTKSPGSQPFTEFTLSHGIYNKPPREFLGYNPNKNNYVSNLTGYHSANYKGVGITFGLNALLDNGYKMSDFDNRLRSNLGIRKVIASKNLVIGINTSVQSGNSGSFLLWESFDKAYTALDSGITETNTFRFNVDPYVKWNIGKFDHSLNTRFLSINNEVDNGDPLNNQSNKSSLIYSEYRSHFGLTKNRFDATGGLVFISTFTSSPLFKGNQQASNYAAYLQLEKGWRRFSFTGGTRFELFQLNQKKEGRPVFRAGLNYKAADFTFLRASYGEGYRFPSIAESYITTTVGPVSIYPNADLQSETGTNVEFGVKQGLRIKKNTDILIDVSLFKMEYNNMMEFTFGQWGPIVPPLFGVGFKTINTGRAEIKGFESSISAETKLKGVEIQGFIGYTYSKSEALNPFKTIAVDNSGRELNYSNTSSNTEDNILKYRPIHSLKSDVIIDFKKLTFGLGFTLQSKIENIDTAFISPPISFFVPGVESANNQELSAFLLINARIGYS
ncbi:MAG: TonB-dependent receptor, partial [Bacteroidia bacterium]|nr:TonB-dependent receptor [Bacteroidia bacterium]